MKQILIAFFIQALPLFAYSSFSETYYSQQEIEQWLEQFEEGDRPAVKPLLDKIDFFSYGKVMRGLSLGHRKLLKQLEEEGIPLSQVDFSKTYCAKSGDLISYFYRTTNKLRASTFHNLDGLKQKNNSERCLVLLDDYISSGTQFLCGSYGRIHADLFNSYRKVFLLVLVANDVAIERFAHLKKGHYEILAQHFARILGPLDHSTEADMLNLMKKIPSDQIELIYVHREQPLSEILSPEERSLLQKYGVSQYLEGVVATQGHTVFFYGSPNNLPDIFWNKKSVRPDGTPWNPLFHRVEDLSLYDCAKYIPEKDQVW